MDPDQGVSDIKSMDLVVSESIASPRLQTFMLGLVGFIALALACIGVYGIISYSIVQRTREIGVRLALGSTPRRIMSLILKEGLTLTIAGALVGLAAAYALTRYVQTLLFEVEPTDPAVFGGVEIVPDAAFSSVNRSAAVQDRSIEKRGLRGLSMACHDCSKNGEKERTMTGYESRGMGRITRQDFSTWLRPKAALGFSSEGLSVGYSFKMPHKGERFSKFFCDIPASPAAAGFYATSPLIPTTL